MWRVICLERGSVGTILSREDGCASGRGLSAPQKKDVVLDAIATNSDEGKEAARAERVERARLLYVGATRARDYLVLALPKSKSGWAWVDELTSDGGGPAFVAVNALRAAAPAPIEETDGSCGAIDRLRWSGRRANGVPAACPEAERRGREDRRGDRPRRPPAVRGLAGHGSVNPLDRFIEVHVHTNSTYMLRKE